MFRKCLLALCCVAMLVFASGSGLASAKQKSPTFEQVFTPPGFPNADTVLAGGLTQFGSYLYISVSSPTYGGQIFRSFKGSSWEPVTSLGFGIDARYRFSWDMTVFQGKLYVPANCFGEENCPGVILRSSNGRDWEQIPLDTGTFQMDKLGVFQGMIYATTVWDGGQIWRSPTGTPGTWQVVQDLEGDVGSTSSPTAYKGDLYISGSAYGNSVYIWRSADGLHWETTSLRITDYPVDPNLEYLRDGMLTVFKGKLYLCVMNTIDLGAIYRTEDGRNWERVVLGPGVFDTSGVWAYTDMIQYQGDLLATSIYYENEDDWGIKLWRSHTGNPGDWELVNTDGGWGLYFFPERGALGVFKGDLYIEDSNSSLYRMNTH